MSKPVVIDLCCGLGGWSRGFIEEGYDAIGFDVERHEYGDKRYPGHLILKDVLTLNGYDLRAANPSVIVASPPCQKYSHMAMPFSRGKREASWQRWERDSPFGDFHLNDLFNACVRIARECGVPIILENVKGAQPWLGRAKWHYGSYYLWGDVPALMPSTLKTKQGGRNFHTYEKYGVPSPSFHGAAHEAGVQRAEGLKTVGHVNKRDGHGHTRHLTNQRESDAVKQPGLSGEAWFNEGAASLSSKSAGRKQASAEIAEIPADLAQWIARCFKP